MEQKKSLKPEKPKTLDIKPVVAEVEDDSSESEGDDIPLIQLKDRPTTPGKLKHQKGKSFFIFLEVYKNSNVSFR